MVIISQVKQDIGIGPCANVIPVNAEMADVPVSRMIFFIIMKPV